MENPETNAELERYKQALNDGYRAFGLDPDSMAPTSISKLIVELQRALARAYEERDDEKRNAIHCHAEAVKSMHAVEMMADALRPFALHARHYDALENPTKPADREYPEDARLDAAHRSDAPRVHDLRHARRMLKFYDENYAPGAAGSAGEAAPLGAEGHWRLGGKQKRNLYQGQRYVGVAFLESDASAIVRAMNGVTTTESEVVSRLAGAVADRILESMDRPIAPSAGAAFYYHDEDGKKWEVLMGHTAASDDDLLETRDATEEDLGRVGFYCQPAAPIPMRLPCPQCRELHIDAGPFATKVHHTHSCQHCGLTWRPAVVPTVGVRFLPGFKDAEAPSVQLTLPPDVVYSTKFYEGGVEVTHGPEATGKAEFSGGALAQIVNIPPLALACSGCRAPVPLQGLYLTLPDEHGICNVYCSAKCRGG